MTKSETCKCCYLYRSPGPLYGYFTGKKVDILFLGHYPTKSDVMRHDMFSGFTEFRDFVKSLFDSYGVVDCIKCTLGTSTDVHMPELPVFCNSLLKQQIEDYQPKILVPVGGLSLQVLQNMYDFRGRKTIEAGGKLIFPIMHPSNPEARLSIVNDLTKLKEMQSEAVKRV